MFDELLGRVEINPAVMLGKPVIRGTRLTVEIILEKLAAGRTVERVREDYPFLAREDVLAALAYARNAIGTDELIPNVTRGR
jgi:uncharacterized protein (DUF433 family)